MNVSVFFSTDSDNHDLLLTVLWDGVVHTSAHVRTTAAKMFEVYTRSYRAISFKGIK